jgi:hypothetical protein
MAKISNIFLIYFVRGGSNQHFYQLVSWLDGKNNHQGVDTISSNIIGTIEKKNEFLLVVFNNLNIMFRLSLLKKFRV